jgi:hypothetical protein
MFGTGILTLGRQTVVIIPPRPTRSDPPENESQIFVTQPMGKLNRHAGIGSTHPTAHTR